MLGSPAEQARVRGELAAIFAQKTAAEWATLLAPHDCLVEVVTELDELSDHPLHRAREVFFRIGDVMQVRTPLGTPTSPAPPPKHGQHSREVLAEYGIDAATIAALVG